tara:strand:+ start:805 stop:2661 length:1857 start_codon:yes stop_codon:yes gene_type:complete
MIKLNDHIKKRFKKRVVLDTEFQSDVSGTYCTKPLCVVYKDLDTGQVLRIWEHDQNNLAQHHFDFETTLFICFYATAEAGYFLKQLMGRPPYIFDCWTEYAKLYKNSRKLSLLAAANAYAFPNPTSEEEKEYFRDKCIKQNTWTKGEQEAILNYCEKDVLMNEHIFYKILNDLENKCGNDYEILLEQAMARGQVMACYAKIARNGVPMDIKKVNEFDTYWPLVKNTVIRKFNKELNLWDENCKFSNDKFYSFIKELDLLSEWPTTPKGRLKTNKETFELFDDTYPEIKKLKRIKNLLGTTQLTDFGLSEDNRHRPRKGYRPFGTHTGRCAPTSNWAFGSSKWGRSFIKPSYGCAIANLDFKSQEALVAGKLSGDKNMIDAYASGDIYMAAAILADMAPADATEDTHPDIRAIWKVIVLASNFGQGAKGMAKGLKKFGKTYSEVAGLLMRYKEMFKVYFDWAKARSNHAQVHGYISTSLGWDRHFPHHVPINPRSLMNWSVQATAAEILRNALLRLHNANIKVCATVHDSVLIECPLPEAQEQVRMAKQCMIDAGDYIIGEGIKVDVDIFYDNFKPKENDQKIFNMLFEEIRKYRSTENLKYGQLPSQNMVRGTNINVI